MLIRGFLWLACVLAASVPVNAHESTRRVLFVGNSLTYVNNLPAAFASLAPQDSPWFVDAFTRPGARLQDDVGNPVLTRLLTQGHYTDVVFQERGGDAVCGPDKASYTELDGSPTVRASVALAAAARAGGARVFYLGTYQPNAAVEPALIRGEQHIAQRMGAAYIELGASWQALRSAYPEADWLASDGVHPGRATTALMALRTWRAVAGRDAATATPCVRGPLYTHAPSESGFFHVDPAARPHTCLVSRAMARVLAGQP